MTVEFNCKRVANLLKSIVNSQCEDGFLWYPNVGEMPSLFDINKAIAILDNTETQTMEITDDMMGKNSLVNDSQRLVKDLVKETKGGIKWKHQS